MTLDQIVNDILRRIERATGMKTKTDSNGSRFLRKFTKNELIVIGSKLDRAGFTPSIKGYWHTDGIFFETNDIYFSITLDGHINFM